MFDRLVTDCDLLCGSGIVESMPFVPPIIIMVAGVALLVLAMISAELWALEGRLDF